MKNRRREDWQRDIDLAQRNIVFPDTAGNEARFWRNILSGRLGVIQVIGIGLLYLMVGGALYSAISTQMRFSDIHGTIWERIIGNFGGWIILLAAAGGALLIGLLISRLSKRVKRPSGRAGKT